MITKNISSKSAQETVPITFDFSKVAPGIDAINSVSVLVRHGEDPDPGAMLLGNATIEGAQVRQIIRGGVNDTTYKLLVNISYGDQKYDLSCYITIKPV